jgi:TrmH family RNA methyltransferase
VEGVKTVLEILSQNLLKVEVILGTGYWMEEHAKQHPNYLPVTTAVDVHELSSLSSFTTAQHVLAVCEMPYHAADPQAVQNELCLYLDGLRDPGNVGTIFRIADWFGIRNVFLAPDTADPFNPKVIQASMASLFRVKWTECELKPFLQLPNAIAFVTSMDGDNIYDAELSNHGLIVLGNESTGVRAIPENVSGIKHISIPSTFRLGAESLNVAVAAGIICAEFRRRDSEKGDSEKVRK